MAHWAATVGGPRALVALAGAGCGSSNHNASPPSTTTTVARTSPAATTSNSAAVSTLLKQGLSQAQAKQLAQAGTTFKNVLLLDPKNVYALYNLGVIDQTQNNTAGAITYYNKALSSDGTYTPAMYNKAIILEATNLDAALALYKQIVAINPRPRRRTCGWPSCTPSKDRTQRRTRPGQKQ